MKFTNTTLHQFVEEIVQYAQAGVFEYEGDVGALVEWIAREYESKLIDEPNVDDLLNDAHEQGFKEGVRACIAKLEDME